jgi:hypothetical protein
MISKGLKKVGAAAIAASLAITMLTITMLASGCQASGGFARYRVQASLRIAGDSAICVGAQVSDSAGSFSFTTPEHCITFRGRNPDGGFDSVEVDGVVMPADSAIEVLNDIEIEVPADSVGTGG